MIVKFYILYQVVLWELTSLPFGMMDGTGGIGISKQNLKQIKFFFFFLVTQSKVNVGALYP